MNLLPAASLYLKHPTTSGTCVAGPELLQYIVILQQLLKLQPFIFEAHYLSKKGLTTNLAKIKGPLTLWDLQYVIVIPWL